MFGTAPSRTANSRTKEPSSDNYYKSTTIPRGGGTIFPISNFYLSKLVLFLMERTQRLFSAFFLLLLLLIASEMGPAAVEARTCESQSHKFKGTCVRQSNCANVCKTEGFQGGKCRGFRRRCFCTKHCVADTEP
ncbi:hypothetical protein LUZ63_010356 [Rhynchospora breviuscula]|uniref:Knottins-like domain-containing protein n=1 Tax=Rhynchospora breviuscula TaxID=2022672 RepID=A0A9Q0HPW5_9POAL|nr:hypothetical protein LUZ63_010356 [Rhynchospora breviuscula]